MLIKEILASCLLSCYIEELVIFKGTIRGVCLYSFSLMFRERRERERESELSGRLKQSHSSSSRTSSVCVGDSLAHLNYPSLRNREGKKKSPLLTSGSHSSLKIRHAQIMNPLRANLIQTLKEQQVIIFLQQELSEKYSVVPISG